MAASHRNAEGATTPESLRRPDRVSETTLESKGVHHLSPTGKALQGVKLSGIDDSGGTRQRASALTSEADSHVRFT